MSKTIVYEDLNAKKLTGTVGKKGLNSVSIVTLNDGGEYFDKVAPKARSNLDQLKEEDIPKNILESTFISIKKVKLLIVNNTDSLIDHVFTALIKNSKKGVFSLQDFKQQLEQGVKEFPDKAKSIDLAYELLAKAYQKEASEISLSEQLSQELFAFMNPHQPRVIRSFDKEGKVHVLSQKVEGYKPLEHQYKDKIPEHFGDTLVYSLWVQEADMHNANIGVNKNGQVVRIDSDWSFAGLRELETSTQIPIEKFYTIDGLPKAPKDNYKWLELSKHNYPFHFSKLDQNPEFRVQVNTGVLNVCLMSDKVIEAFVDAYAGDTPSEPHVKLLQSRGATIKKCALLNLDFYKYMQSEQAEKDLENYLTRLGDFKPDSKNKFLDGEALKFAEQDAKKEFSNLRKYCEKNYNQMKKMDSCLGKRRLILSYLDEINSNAKHSKNKGFQAIAKEWHAQHVQDLDKAFNLENFDDTYVDKIYMVLKKADAISNYIYGSHFDRKKDKLFQEWLKKAQESFEAIISKEPMDFNAIDQLHMEAMQVKDSLESKEIVHVEREVSRLRKESTSFTIGYKNKAQVLSDALMAIPPSDRGTVLSGKPNRVQKIMATEAWQLKIGYVSDLKGSTTQSFKNIKKEYQDMDPEKKEENEGKKNYKVPK